MSNNMILSRINEVLITDAVAADRINFLSVHTPFNNILYSQSGSASSLVDRISENDIYDKFLLDDKKEHKFIIVRGDNGTGKSHLIRVLNEKYKKDFNNSEEEIIFIAKYQSTLRGTIEQLLEIDIIKNSPKSEEVRALIDANDHLDDIRLKDNIIHQFAIEVDHSEKKMDRKIKKGLSSLMLDPVFKNHLLRDGGPINRIYSKLIEKDNVKINDDVEPIFFSDDFTIELELLSNIKAGGASRDTLRLAERLVKDDAIEYSTEISEILNLYLDRVIQTCTNLRSTDLKKVFMNIRKDLKKQNKTLTLFIEDITSFTGVDQAIIDILVAPHVGVDQNSELCRICSFVGITTNYYRNKFPAHLQDRVTDQLFIGEDSFGSIDNLKELAGRYINAVYQTKDDFKNWVLNGAGHNDIPIYSNDELLSWEYFQLENGSKLTLYPFTENALINLYDSLDQKSPRLFIKEVIKRYLEQFYTDKRKFLSKVNVQLPGWNPPNHGMSLRNQVKEEEFKRLDIIFRLWGNGTIYKERTQQHDSIGGINTKFFGTIDAPLIKGIDKYPDTNSINNTKSKSKQTDGGMSVSRTGTTGIVQQKNTKNDEFEKLVLNIEEWSVGEPLKNFIRLRDTLYRFLNTSVDWEIEGVSPYLKDKVFGTSFVAIEGQTQGLERAKIVLERSPEGRMVLLGLASWLYLGDQTWNFDNAAEYQLYLVNWLQGIQEKLTDIVLNPYSNINYLENDLLRYSVMVEFYRLSIAGEIIPGETEYSFYNKLMRNKLDINENEYHSTHWNKVVNEFNNSDYEENHQLIISYFKRMIGDAKNRSDKGFIDSSLMLNLIRGCIKSKWLIDIKEIEEVSIEETNIYSLPLKLFKKQSKLIITTLREETIKSNEIIAILENNLGEIEISTIKSTLKKIKGYLGLLTEEYKEPFESKLLITCNNLLGKYDEIFKNACKLKEITSEKFTNSEKMAILSTNPFEYTSELSYLFKEVEMLVNNMETKYSKKCEDNKRLIERQYISPNMIKSNIKGIIVQYKKSGEVL